MKNLPIYFLLIITTLPLFGCQKSNKQSTQIDNKSYINNFELLQENPNNHTRIRITSPKAIINPTNNDIDILIYCSYRFQNNIYILQDICRHLYRSL